MRRLAILVFAATSAAAATVPVTVNPSTFNPPSVTINVGDTVQWNWSLGAGTHTTTSDATTGPDVWDSGAMSSGSYSHVFNTAGTHRYYCSFHGAPGGIGMSGIVQVNVPAPAPTVTSVAPPAAAQGVAVTLTGTNFQNGAAVTFGGVNSALVTFVNATALQAQVPVVGPGTVAIVVTNPDGQSASLNGFIVLGAAAIPALSHIALAVLAIALAFVILRR